MDRAHILPRPLPTFVAVAVCAGVLLVAACDRGPAVPQPAALDDLDPQLKAYIDEHVALVEEAPNDPARYATLGLVYEANALWQEAREAFRIAIDLDATEPLTRLHLGFALDRLGESEALLATYRQLVADFPDFLPGLDRLGASLVQAGELDEAEQVFRQMRTVAPNEWRGPAGLGEVALLRNDYPQAAAHLEQATAMAPGANIAHYQLGMAYRNLGRLEEAQREIRRGFPGEKIYVVDAWTAQLAPHRKTLGDQFKTARDYMDQRQGDRAVALLEETYRWHPDNLDVMSNLGLAYLSAGQPDKTRELLLEVLAQDDTRYRDHMNLAACSLSLGLGDEALAHADRTVELRPDLPQAHLARANVLIQLRRPQEAKAAADTARRLAPNHPNLPLIDQQLRQMGVR